MKVSSMVFPSFKGEWMYMCSFFLSCLLDLGSFPSLCFWTVNVDIEAFAVL